MKLITRNVNIRSDRANEDRSPFPDADQAPGDEHEGHEGQQGPNKVGPHRVQQVSATSKAKLVVMPHAGQG